MAISREFSFHMLNNFCDNPNKGLSGFMSGKNALKKLEIEAEKPHVPISSYRPYFNNVDAFVISFADIGQKIMKTFCIALSYLLHGVGLSTVSKRLYVYGQQATRNWEQLTYQWQFGKSLLLPSFLMHKYEDSDVYGVGTIFLKDLNDEKVLTMTLRSCEFRTGVRRAMHVFFHYLEKSRVDQDWFAWARSWGRTVSKRERNRTILAFTNKYKQNPEHAIDFLREKYSLDDLEKAIQHLYTELKKTDRQVATRGELQLFCPNRLSHGACLWFIWLILHSQQFFDDNFHHVMAVSRQFIQGVPKEGVLLQALHEPNELMHLKRVDLHDYKVTLYELEQDHESALEKVAALPLGIYKVRLRDDFFVVYMKLSDTEEYVWNPSYGLLNKGAEGLIKMVLDLYHEDGNPDSLISFHRYTSTLPGAAV